MKSILILNAKVVNEGKVFEADVFIKEGRIEKLVSDLAHLKADKIIDASGKYLLPGVIDDQVHFREPGLTHKAEIYTEAKAAVAGGVTTFMEMPNTVPNALSQALLEDKYKRASEVSLANYSFYMGVSNDNLEEVLQTDPLRVCGIKIFMGSSTGNMLVDHEETLEKIFANAPCLIATHCEYEPEIKKNLQLYREKYGENISPKYHPEIRSREACLRSSQIAVTLAKKHRTRLHILHITTEAETDLFSNQLPLKDKKITSEACVHHLWYNETQYETLGNLIKCNPAIKKESDRQAIWKALLDDRIDVIATDHAPHTWEEKQKNYWEAPSGLPLIQYALPMMLEFYHQGQISLEKIAWKMSHAPAICFQIKERGFIREGYWADLTLLDLDQKTSVTPSQILYKCGWSPLQGHTFLSAITHTFVSGHLVFSNGEFDESIKGKRLLFER